MSFLLDSNVVSELIRRVRNPAVVSWAASSALEDFYFSAVAEAELRYGPHSCRRVAADKRC